ncbi:hypothetical protein HYDPIDRAFT_116719 [Hydnomerulius pinastri MD-312]|uniref:AB hydrolase-1 domain-containing protein n=1 Tax=Hydnomerulius pinastri MD-312 TaxID=994086 RepID=A0A0C9V5M3_9AGAM|nr:hypothetical protein HYDPIDRAFT_116719 [Hydnomerulius pinastri MD-312]
MSTALSASTWGPPTAIKHVLLIHGLTSSSQVWYRVAQDFAARGYSVTAPDLLGHGTARRAVSDYTVSALAEEFRPLLTATPASANGGRYDVVIGHSLGGLVALALLPLLKSDRPVRVVLVDPPLEQSPELVAHYRKLYPFNVRNPKTAEAHLEANPLWTKEDAAFKALSERLCDPVAVEAIFDQNVPWSFSHHLTTIPDNVNLTILAADPSKTPCVKEEDLKVYPHVIAKTVWGATHSIPREFPEVIVQSALEEIEIAN